MLRKLYRKNYKRVYIDIKLSIETSVPDRICAVCLSENENCQGHIRECREMNEGCFSYWYIPYNPYK